MVAGRFEGEVADMELDMHLEVGDRLLVAERHGEEAGHVCRILSARGPGGGPPYVVLRYDTGDEELLAPGPNLDIRILTHAPA